MPKLQVSVPHSLDKSVAIERLKGFSTQFREQFRNQISNLEENWDGDNLDFSISAVGLTVKGAMGVNPSSVDVRANLPFAALPFRGKIESSIRESIERALASDTP